MNNIPPKLKTELAVDPYYKVCARSGLFGHVCSGRVTWEHALYYAGKQIQARFAIVPLCEFAHSVCKYQDGGDMSKEINVWIALNRATDDELRAISKTINYLRERQRLNNIYGVYVEPKQLEKINY